MQPMPKPEKTEYDKDENQMRCGSWDPKFLEKKTINKYYPNHGQVYQDGQISTWSNAKKGAHYNKVKGKRTQNKKTRNKQQTAFDSTNIFSQTFGCPGELDQSEPVPNEEMNPVPFLNLSDPPETKKFSNFNQNFSKSHKKKHESAQNNTAFSKGPSFSDQFHMQGPLKSSRLPKKDAVELPKSSLELKKSKSSDQDFTGKFMQYFRDHFNNNLI